MAEQPSSGSNTLKIVLIVVGAALLFVVAIVGIMATLAVHGARRYIADAKTMEGKMESHRLALGIAACGGRDALPPSSPAVPASLGQVSGKKYMSSPSDWSDKAFACGSFSMTSPQYFQYQWVADSPTAGKVTAQADLDGDGKPDVSFENAVTCGGGSCSAAAAPVEKKF